MSIYWGRLLNDGRVGDETLCAHTPSTGPAAADKGSLRHSESRGKVSWSKCFVFCFFWLCVKQAEILKFLPL